MATDTGRRGGAGLQATVVVLGDLGRSPRMLHHALALADVGASVSLVGRSGSELPRLILDNDRIAVHRVPAAKRLRGLLRAPWSFVEAAMLLAVLLRTPRPDVVLVQNPPGFPTLPVALAAARLRGSRLVIDWHNLGHTVLALRLGRNHLAVRCLERHDRSLARRADAHLCVSTAMAAELQEHWRLGSPHRVHDRPLARVEPIRGIERDELLKRLGIEPQQPVSARPSAILVCPTSWSLDEDLGLLLEAAARWDEMVRRQAELPDLQVIVTGRGPLRRRFEEEQRHTHLDHVRIQTAWVPAENYPHLLAAADVGLCFHSSTSGIDLPIKLADMLGAGLPVCALDYGPVLGELLRPGETGLLFSDAADLGSKLRDLLTGFPTHSSLFDQLQRSIGELEVPLWIEEWQRQALPALVGSRDGTAQS